MHPEDLPRVCEIEQRSFADPWPQEAFEGVCGFHSFVALEAGTVIGYIICISVLDESGIANIAIDPDHQRRGHGAGLLTHALEQLAAEGVRKVFLDVRPSNTAARAMYEKFGFKYLGVRKNYYSHPPEDALVMMKKDEEA